MSNKKKYKMPVYFKFFVKEGLFEKVNGDVFTEVLKILFDTAPIKFEGGIEFRKDEKGRFIFDVILTEERVPDEEWDKIVQQKEKFQGSPVHPLYPEVVKVLKSAGELLEKELGFSDWFIEPKIN